MKTLRNILLTFILFFTSGCTLFGVWGLNQYSVEPTEGWVIDADTKQPLEGVIVVADWVLYGGLHYDEVGRLEVMETVTDANGRFRFPGWGPKIAIKGELTSKVPDLLFAKPGYDHRVFYSGKRIEMKKFQGDDEAYGKRVSSLSSLMSFAYDGENCEWQKTPRMISFLHREKYRLYFLGVRQWISSVFDVKRKGCASPYEVFKPYLPELRPTRSETADAAKRRDAARRRR